MPDLAIRVENLCKQYTIAAAGLRHDTLRDQLAHGLRSLISLNGQRSAIPGLRSTVGGQPSPQGDTLWALKDVSFEVNQGEVVGIIGRNGAGKSTLLKVLSRITTPSSGYVEMRGRVGSLLEVGTGFDRELTGRENVYLNGAILGMRKAEIDRKFDEIVEFSGVERFIDTPVKRYSSGMFVRLAFAVAAHLDPAILIVDEVLSVGDAAFQRKCIGKMGEVAKTGRTVLFVSHDMTAVANLCTRAMLLEHGRVSYCGAPMEVVPFYLQNIQPFTARGERTLEPASGLPFTVKAVRTCDDQLHATGVFPRSSPIFVLIEGEVHDMQGESGECLIAVDVKTTGDMMLFRTHNIEQLEAGGIRRRGGPFVLRCVIPADLFPAGTYRLGLFTAIAGGRALEYMYPVLEFDIVQDRLMVNHYTTIEGVLTPQCDWSNLTPVASQ